MFIPIGLDMEEVRRTPVVTGTIRALNGAILLATLLAFH